MQAGPEKKDIVGGVFVIYFAAMWEQLLKQFHNTSPLEWMAFVCGVLQVLLARLNLRINFLAGLVSVVLYTYVFMQARLYAESLLNAYYALISLWGWWQWSDSGQSHEAISTFKRTHWLRASGFTAFVFGLLYLWLHRFTDSNLPAWDAVVTAFAWIGSYYLVHRKLENWLFLTVSNVVAIPVQWSKGLELTALLSVVFLVMGLLGYFRWRKLLRNSEHIT